jgi:hypothetical protein
MINNKTYIDISTILSTVKGHTGSESNDLTIISASTSSSSRYVSWETFIRNNLPGRHKNLFTKPHIPPLYIPDHSSENASDDEAYAESKLFSVGKK